MLTSVYKFVPSQKVKAKNLGPGSWAQGLRPRSQSLETQAQKPGPCSQSAEAQRP